MKLFFICIFITVRIYIENSYTNFEKKLTAKLPKNNWIAPYLQFHNFCGAS